MKLFLTAFLQVMCINANIYFIAKGFWIGIIVFGFLISFIWSYNVKRISISEMKERILYSSGASLGGVLGVLISHLIV